VSKRSPKKKGSGAPASTAKSDNVVARARAGRSGSKTPMGVAIWDNIKSLAGAVLIYLVIKTFLMEAFRIPSGSMIPTLMVGDWLFVSKIEYGAHVPFTHSHLPGYRDPQHGDVVVFESPYQLDEDSVGHDPTPTLVKRLIGAPGDTLYMRDGMVYRNGIAQRQGFGADKNWKGMPDETSYHFDWQHQYELKESRFGPAPAQPTHDNWGPIVIPEKHYFMMGDNRYCSKDSRYWGLVPRENIRGRPMFVYYSYRTSANPSEESSDCNPDTSDRALPFITDIRWSRLGHWIR
jgi:signal peptidase I